VAKYESPSGKKLQDDGVTPDVLVASGMDDQADVDDEALPQIAPSAPVGKKPCPTKGCEKAGDAVPAPGTKSSVQVDEQLTKALDILKGEAA
jgi:carboxyl-terminal processing protease